MSVQIDTKLTNTTSQNVFPIARPNNNHVTFSFELDRSRPGITRITLPEGSTWTPSPHWHETHTEYLQVISGRILVILDGVPRLVTPQDGPQTIQRYVVHDWMRADRGSVQKDSGDVVVDEWTDPADGIKQVFFRNLLSVIADAGNYWRSWTVLQIFLICSVYDNYEVLAPGFVPKSLSWAITHLVYAFVRGVAAIIGLDPWYKAYTPDDLRDIAKLGGQLESSHSKNQ